VDRPTRMVVTPGERLPRCCEYGAFPAHGARPLSSARGPRSDQYRFRPLVLRVRRPREAWVGRSEGAVRIADASRRSRAACSRAGPGGHRFRLVRWQWSLGANRAGGGTRTGAEPARQRREPSSPRRRRQLLQRGEARRDARSCHLLHLLHRACPGGVALGLPGVLVRARGRAGRLGPTTPTTSSAPRAATATPPSLGSARLSGLRAQRHRGRGHHGRAARRRLGTGLETGRWEPAVALLRRAPGRWPRVCRGWSPTAAGAEIGRADRWFRPPPHLDRERRVIVAQLPNSRRSRRMTCGGLPPLSPEAAPGTRRAPR
jgi:hypothetical protein